MNDNELKKNCDKIDATLPFNFVYNIQFTRTTTKTKSIYRKIVVSFQFPHFYMIYHSFPKWFLVHQYYMLRSFSKKTQKDIS